MPVVPGGETVAGSRVESGSITVQILLDLKNSDPTALTAAEAIRHLLGFGDRLVEVRRRSLHEVALRSTPAGAALSELLSAYLERTVVFWNPNKQRAWVRAPQADNADAAWEVRSGGRRHPGDFGTPDLSRPEFDHLIVWPRGDDALPADLPTALPGWDVTAAFRGELWSIRWRDGASTGERSDWTVAVGAARSRREGLLCNPHAQHYRVLSGAVPIPLWTSGGAGAGARAGGGA